MPALFDCIQQTGHADLNKVFLWFAGGRKLPAQASHEWFVIGYQCRSNRLVVSLAVNAQQSECF